MSNLTIARSYRELGWNVVPAQPHNAVNKDGKPAKRPFGLWEHLQTEMLDESKFEELFTEDRNVGMMTGAISGIDVLDLDNYKQNYWDKFGQMDGFKAETPLQVLTQGGGIHCYFAHTPGLRNTAGGKEKSGIDFRADGGFIMLPPSYFDPEKPYKWILEPTKEIVASLPRIPEWIVEQILKPSVAKKSNGKYDTLTPMPEGGRDYHIFGVSLRVPKNIFVVLLV